MFKTVIILGSSRSNGNTANLCVTVAKALNAAVFDLNDYVIGPYRYDQCYDDDFQLLIRGVIQYDRIILATPMYWYTASAQMKTFLDRLSDLLEKDNIQGQALKRKKAALLGTGKDIQPPDCFEAVFAKTFNYLGMTYEGMFYSSVNQLEKESTYNFQLNEFCQSLV